MKLFRWAIRITIWLDRDRTGWFLMGQDLRKTLEEELDFMYEKVEE